MEKNVVEPAILPFDWEDALGLDAQLTDEERMVRDTAEGYAQASQRRHLWRGRARLAKETVTS